MILIALGSNLGDREAMLRQAIVELEAVGVKIIERSGIVETKALLPTGAPPAWNMPYLNQVLLVETAQSPEALLTAMKAIESQMGRTDRGSWAPREIDLDLLAYHKETREGEALTLPHPQMAYRRFVLGPVAEIAPGWRHPTLDKTAGELLAELSQ